MVFAAVAVLTVWRIHREKRGAHAQELEKIERVRGTLQRLLQGSVFGLVTAAEREYGPGGGAIKKSAVLTEMLRLIPERWRELFDVDTCGALIESGLISAKEIWAASAN